MEHKDYLVQRMREDPKLKKSFEGSIDDLCDILMREMVSNNEMDALRMAQGAIRGLLRYKTRLLAAIAPKANPK